MPAYRLTIAHVDTCLPDYWAGHSAAYVCIPVRPGMTADDIRDALHAEIHGGDIAGSRPDPEVVESPEWIDACHVAIDAMPFQGGEGATYFDHIEDAGDDGESVYAYFIFTGSE